MITKEDVASVAESLGEKLTDAELTEALNRFDFEAKEDPSATWNLVAEKIMYDLIDERITVSRFTAIDSLKKKFPGNDAASWSLNTDEELGRWYAEYILGDVRKVVYMS